MMAGIPSQVGFDQENSHKKQTDKEIFDAFMRQICEMEPTQEDENSFRCVREREKREEMA